MPAKKKLRRLVLNFPGFETTSAEHQLGRLANGGQNTAGVWGFKLTQDASQLEKDTYKIVTHFTSTAENWDTQTRFVQFSWDDIIKQYEEVRYPQSLLTSLPKYLSFFLDGSIIKYANTSARYFGFTIYPLVVMALFATISGYVGSGLNSWFGLNGMIATVIAIILFLVLCRFPGDLLYLNLSINDWAFARDMCNRKNLEIESRYETFANSIIDELEDSDFDEILVVGHSFGAVWAVAALAKALADKPELLERKNIVFLALGSSLLKITLVKNAAHFVKYLKVIISNKNLFWHEIQTRLDCISFYKAHPFTPLGIDDYSCGFIYDRVNFSEAISTQRHKKMMSSFYRIHRQYILYSDKRVHFDFQIRCFGPFFARELAKNKTLIDNPELLSPPTKRTKAE